MPRGDIPVFIFCAMCSKKKRISPSTLKRGGVFCSRTCQLKSYKGAGNPNWKGGRILDGHGRAMVYVPGNPHATMMGGTHAYEYRLIAARKVGRPLRSSEIVHHINGDHTDNRPENLEVMTQGQHLLAHDLPRKGGQALAAKFRSVQ